MGLVAVAVTTAVADNNPQKAAAGVAKMVATAVPGAEAAVVVADVVFHVCQKFYV